MKLKGLTCARCNKPLRKVSYCEPDWYGILAVHERKPLCKACWEIADKEASQAAGAVAPVQALADTYSYMKRTRRTRIKMWFLCRLLPIRIERWD